MGATELDDHAWSEVLARARASWPGVPFPWSPPDSWRRALAALAKRPVDDALADWCLVQMAIEQEPQALRTIDGCITSVVGGWLRARRYPEGLRDDALQRVRVALLGGEGRPPRLAEFGGRGPLSRWLRIVGSRLALNVLRDAAPLLPEQAMSEGSGEWTPHALGQTPEVALLREEHRAAFKSAFERAVNRLDDRSRVLLGLRFKQQLDVESIARVYRVHRVTAARWLAQARDLFQAALKDELRAFSPIPGADVDELDAWLVSAPDLSLSRLFVLAK